jgi:shikimate kinase
MSDEKDHLPPATLEAIAANDRSIVLVGLMGAGKTSVGRRLAKHLHLPFSDADAEIVKAAGLSIPDIFRLYGEPAFRDGERRVIERLMREGRKVLATGGGAFMDPDTRAIIRKRGISLWLRADLDVLVRRIGRRDDRPLLAGGDPRVILGGLIKQRYPMYAEADLIVDTGDEAADATVEKAIVALQTYMNEADRR